MPSKVKLIPVAVPLDTAVRRYSPVEDLAETVGTRLDLRRAVRALPGLERRVIALRFGLVGGEKLSLDEVGPLVGMTPRGVLGVERRALALLKCRLLADDEPVAA